MYDFIDVNEQASSRRISSIAMQFNGKYIEDAIQGYRTLNASGRETLSHSVDMQEGISGRDGAIVFDKTLPVRYLDVQYELKAKTSKELQYKYRRLAEVLASEGEVPIQFLDEPNITYYGQLVEMEQPDESRLNVVSRFRILCSDPYKYDAESIVEGNPLHVYLKSIQAVKPALIDVKITSTTNKVIVRNESTARRIILNGDYKNGDRIQVLISESKVLKNGQDITKELDYVESDFHSFLVKNADKISVSPSSSELGLHLQSRWK